MTARKERAAVECHWNYSEFPEDEGIYEQSIVPPQGSADIKMKVSEGAQKRKSKRRAFQLVLLVVRQWSLSSSYTFSSQP